MVPEGDLCGTPGQSLQGQGATDCSRQTALAPQGAPKDVSKGACSLVAMHGADCGPVCGARNTRRKISDLRDLSWERCFKPLYLLLLMCA